VALVGTDVSEERIPSIIMVTRFGELGATLAVTSNRSAAKKRRLLNEPNGVTSQRTAFSKELPYSNESRKCAIITVMKKEFVVVIIIIIFLLLILLLVNDESSCCRTRKEVRTKSVKVCFSVNFASVMNYVNEVSLWMYQIISRVTIIGHGRYIFTKYIK
jgi:hypothetical protein